MAGFLALRTQSQGDYTGKLETYAVLAAAATGIIAPGDPVIIDGTGDATGRGSVIRATSETTALTGIVASIEPRYVGENFSGTGLPASTDGFVNVHIAQDQLFLVDIQDGSGAAGVLTTASVNANAEMDLTNASTNPDGLTRSGAALSNTPAPTTTATLPFRIVGLTDPDPVTPTNFRQAIVRINSSTIKSGVAGV